MGRGSARSQVAVREVRDGILVLPGRRYRAVLAASSLNFELLSEAEQDVLVDAFQSFLNSLSGPVQILVRVRELDLDRYLEALAAGRAGEDRPVYREQLSRYADFLRGLVSGNRILTRRFYLVIPYDDRANAGFEAVREQLSLEQEIVAKGLEKLGVAARPLSTLETLDLFYGFYRPESAKTQPLAEAILRNSDAAAV